MVVWHQRRKLGWITACIWLALVLVLLLIIHFSQSFLGQAEAASDQEPILVADAQKFNEIRLELDQHYKLVSDIDLSGYSDWQPIGDKDNAFTGVLDGNGFTIKNVTIKSSDTNPIGLFGKIDGGTVKHLFVENVDIQIDPYAEVSSGAFAGEIINSTIDNVHVVSGEVSGGTSFTGGFAGKISGGSSVSNSSTAAHVTGFDDMGGFAGHITGQTKVLQSSASGDVTKHSDRVIKYMGEHYRPYIIGGFVGRLGDGATLERVYSEGNVKGNNRTGGLIGQTLGGGKVSDAYAIGDVIGLDGSDDESKAQWIGGLIGHNHSIDGVTRAYAIGQPSGTDHIGGLVGRNENNNISDSYWNMDIYGDSPVGEGKTTAEMQDQSTYVGWHFDHTWLIESGEYPVLRLAKQFILNGGALSESEILLKGIDKTFEISKVEALFPNGHTYDVTAAAQLSSSDETVVTVDGSGLITAVGPGSAEIYIHYQGRTEILHIDVLIPNDYVLQFNGTQNSSDAFVKVNYSPELQITNDLTFEAWVNWDGGDGYRVFVSKPQQASVTGWAFVINDGKPEVHAQRNTGTNPNVSVKSGVKLYPQSWHHLAFTYDTHGDARLYLDGILRDEQMWGTSGIKLDQETPLLIGREFENYLPDRNFGGHIDEVRIWNTVLTDETIAEWYTRTDLDGHPAKSSLAGHWSFDEGSGEIAGDSSGNNQHGELKNNPVWVLRDKVVDAYTLHETIEKAEQKLADHPIGNGLGQVPEAAHDQLNDIIEQAQDDFNHNPLLTQQEIDMMTEDIEQAIEQFLGAVIQARPGGVQQGSSLWLKADEGAQQDQDGNLIEWVDQTGINDFTVIGSPAYIDDAINFNAAVSFSNGKEITKLPSHYIVGNTEIAYADVYAVFKWHNDIDAGTIVGSINPGSNYGLAILSGTGKDLAVGTGADGIWNYVEFEGNDRYYLANYDIYDATKHSSRIDGNATEIKRTQAFSTFHITPIIGGTNGGGNESNWYPYNGEVAEIIIYDQSTALDRSKIESYLAIKYGLTLGDGGSDYVATNGEIIWEKDSTYKHNIAGIGRDDLQALNQKQSRSVHVDTPQIVISLGELASTNQQNTSEFTADRQYLVWGDNGQDLAYEHQLGSSNQYRLARVWKVANTNDVGKVQVAIPADDLPFGAQHLMVSDDDEFTNVETYSVTSMELNGESYLMASDVTLKDGQFFTFTTYKYTVTYSAGVGGTIDGIASQEIWHGFDASSVTAVPNVGYYFDQWDDGVKVATREDTEITENMTFEAEFEAAVVSAHHSTVVADPEVVIADGNDRSTITVTVLDQYGNPIMGKDVKLVTAGGSSVITPAESSSISDGTVTFEVSNTKAGEVTYKAEVEGVELEESVTVTFNAGDVALSKIDIEPSVIRADGVATGEITVTLSDTNDNPVANHQVELELIEGQAIILSSIETTNTDGQAIFSIKNAHPETVKLRVKYVTSSTSIEQDIEVTFGGALISADQLTLIEGGAEESYEISLNAAPTHPVTIKVTGSEEVIIPVNEYIFTDANWHISQVVNIRAKDSTAPEHVVINHTLTSDDLLFDNLPVASIAVEIIETEVVELITQPSVTLWLGGEAQQQLTVEALLSNEHTIDVTTSDTGTTYTSSDPGIVTVTADGLLEAQKVGETTVVVSNNGIDETIDVIVYRRIAHTEDQRVEVLINGQSLTAGTAKISVRNNQLTVTVAVNEDMIRQRLEDEDDGAVISILSPLQSGVMVGELNGQMVKHMEQAEAVIEVITQKALYTLPAQQIQIDDVSNQIGEDIALQNIIVQIEIAETSSDTVQIIENAAQEGTFAIVAPPLDFSVQAIYGDRTIDITRYHAYVARMIALPEDTDANKITTAVVLEADGTMRHVPTKVTVIDGRYYAQVNSLTNSTYTVIWHPFEFTDLANHWAKDAINNMGSRMVVNGVGGNIYHPDRHMTRAEFAAITVRALGLGVDNDPSRFSDVKQSDWFSRVIQTAVSYNLIHGYTDGTFRPMDKITREQAMMIISHAMKLTNMQGIQAGESEDEILEKFTDAHNISNWAIQGVANSIGAGIVMGRNNDILDPKSYITRAEVAVMMQRLLQRSDLID